MKELFKGWIIIVLGSFSIQTEIVKIVKVTNIHMKWRKFINANIVHCTKNEVFH